VEANSNVVFHTSISDQFINSPAINGAIMTSRCSNILPRPEIHLDERCTGGLCRKAPVGGRPGLLPPCRRAGPTGAFASLGDV